MDINNLLKIAIMKGASDMHMKVGAQPIVRINGTLMPIENAPFISSTDIVSSAFQLMNSEQKERFNKHCEVDMAYGVKGLGRFRLNVYQQRGTISMVFRTIPTVINSITDLGLPKIIESLAMEQRGLVLVTGTTGSGKTTTLASMIHFINKARTCNIISIEDPIEYLHNDEKSIISQREVGADTESFGIALRSALRQDPDVIMVGEMRDFETISTAITAAETGHLVMSTLHTTNAQETIHRIISVFPPYQQKQIRLQLASAIRGVISMRLIPQKNGAGRVPAVEIMTTTQTIREAMINPDKTRTIYDIMTKSASVYGMQTFDQSLMDLVKRDIVEYEEALKWCTNADDFALRMKGIESTSGMAWDLSQEQDNDNNLELEDDKKDEDDEFKRKIERF